MPKIFVKNRVSYFRHEFGLSQSDLAEMCGVSKNCISAIERGIWCPSLKLALSVAFVFGRPVDCIFWLTGGDSGE